MTGENLESTVLHEHRKVVTFRHILAIVNFIAILVGTLVTKHFILIRGSSDMILTTINVLWIINAAQILLCLADYVFKVFLGRYLGFLVKISYFTGLVWLGVVIAQTVLASLELGELRLDLLVISALQLLTAIIAYIIWPSMDHAAVQAMTHQNVRDNKVKRARKSRKSVVNYILVCIFMIAIQGGMLLAYKIPPKVYDLFAESRALQYRLNEEGTGYEVIGVYKGTSSYVNIPAVYNNKPVTKIASGALSDITLLEQHKINTVVIGTPVQDENGNIVYESNVSIIETGAIDNNKITTLNLPISVLKIEDGAIQSNSLKTLVYGAKADFSYSILDCPAITTVTFEGEDVGKIVSLDGMQSNVTIEVAKDIYNNYREKNKDYMQSLRPILSDNEFVVDFYTGTDYYIESIFGEIGSKVLVGYQDLKNDLITDKTSIAVDTLAYIKNKHETGTAGAKADSAFRGWYYDRSYAEECLFDENTKIEFTKDTAIYAKWITEYTGTLNWGTYYPEGQAQVLYWTDEDLVTFPVISDRAGYSDGINWYLDNTQVTNSQNISKSVALRGEWLFDKPVIDIEPYAQNSEDTSFVISTDKNTVSFVYDRFQTVSLDAIMTHGLEGVKYNGVEFGYSTDWVKVNDSAYSKADRTVRLQNVAESGEYILTVTAKSPYGEESTSETRITVNIARKNIDLGDFKLQNYSGIYNSLYQHATHTGNIVDEGVKVTYSYFNEAGNQISSNDGVKDVGRYTVKAFFEKINSEEAANYNTKELIAEFVITPFELGFDSWTASSFIYNSNPQSVYLKLTGIYAGDVVNVIYEDGSNIATNAGKYTAKAVGISNPNYSIGNIRDYCTLSWEINRKEVTVKEWLLDGRTTTDFKITYNGEVHTLTAVPEGIFTSDLGNVNFKYEEPANIVSAKDANKYEAKITGVDNDNYVFNGTSTQAWEISKRAITVHFETLPKVIYNGNEQYIKATLTGIVENDLSGFNIDDFAFVGKSAGLNVANPVIDGGNIVISFGAKNAAAYTAAISGINTASAENRNYTIASTEKSFEITPKALSFINTNSYVYNGKYQLIGIKVSGIAQEDLAAVKLDQFTSSVAENGSVVGSDYVISFNAKDAGAYDIDVTAFNNSNYTMTSYVGTISIAKKTLSLNWNIKDLKTNESDSVSEADQVTYNYSGYTLHCDIVGLVNGEIVELTYSGATGKNAGNYKTTVSLANTYSNYYLKTEELNWKINPYKLNFTWEFNGSTENVTGGNVPSFVYSAQEVKIRPVYELLGDDTVTLTYKSGSQDLAKTNASSTNYKVEIQSLNSSNYSIGTGSSFEWKIVPREITITWNNSGESMVYDGKYHGIRFNVTGLIETEDRYIPVYLHYASDSTQVILDNLEFNAATMNSENVINNAVINADKYTVTVGALCVKSGDIYSGTVDNNYTVKASGFDITIEKAPITLKGWQYLINNSGEYIDFTDSTRLVYGKKNYTFVNNIKSGIMSRSGVSDNVYLSYSIDNGCVNAGNYQTKVSLSGSHANNYYIVSGDIVSWEIEPKLICVNWTDHGFVYSGSSLKQTATYLTGAETDDDLLVYNSDTLNFKYADNTKTNAGNYTASITSIGNTNYVIRPVDESYEWSIAPCPVVLSWNTNSFTYNGGIQYPTAQYTSSIYVTEYEMSNSKNAGTYSIKPLKLNSDNYVIDQSSAGYFTYVISPIVANFTWGFDSNKSGAAGYVYDGTSRVLNAYISNICAGDSVTLLYSATNRTVRDAKTYTLTVTGIDSDNYILTADSTNTTKSLTVTPLTIQLSWGFNGSKSGAGDFTYDGKEKTIAAYVSNICMGDTVNFTYSSSSSLIIKNADTYEIQVISCDNSNYVLPTSTSKTINVSRKVLSFDWYFDSNKSTTATSFTYDGVARILNAQPSASTLCSGDDVQVVFDSANRSILNAGSHVFSITGLTGADANNYSLPAQSSCTKTITVNKQIVTISWSGNSTTVYNGNLQTLTATIKGTNNGSIVTFAPIYSSNTNGYTDAGNYTITVSGIAGEIAENYTLPTNGTQKKNLTIQQQPVKVTWTGSTSVTYSGSSYSLKATVVGATDGEIVSFGYNNNNVNSYVNAGTYTISVTLNNSNYTTSGVSASNTLVINPKTVTISWSGSANVVYDGQGHRLTPQVYGINNTLLSGITYTTAYITNVGSQEYVVSAISDKNYTLPTDGTAKKTLTVEPQPVKITWEGETTQKYFYGKDCSLTAHVVGKTNGATVSFVYENGNTYAEVGTKTIKVASLNDKNYTLDGAEGSRSATLTVVPQTVSITWTISGVVANEKTVTYDGKYHYIDYQIVGDDGHTITGKVSGSQYGKDAGTYTLSITELNNKNYTIEGCDGATSATLTINPMKLTVSWTGNGTITYDGITHTVNATVVDESGNNVAFTYDGSNSFTNKGSYEVTIQISGLNSKNYKVVSGSLTTTITIK